MTMVALWKAMRKRHLILVLVSATALATAIYIYLNVNISKMVAWSLLIRADRYFLVSTNQQQLPELRHLTAPWRRWNGLIDYDLVTSASQTKLIFPNFKGIYAKGDILRMKIVALDRRGRRKRYGGDFFRAKLVSKDSVNASTAGKITDHGDGTYTVLFALAWAGVVQVHTQLVHPSEAIEVIKQIRDTVPNRRVFFCLFHDQSHPGEWTPCTGQRNTSLPRKMICDFSKKSVNATWYCERPKHHTCDTIHVCKFDYNRTKRLVESLVTRDEKKLFSRLLLKRDMRRSTPIRVVDRGIQPEVLPRCGPHLAQAESEGYWYNGLWYSMSCRARHFHRSADVLQCLRNKTIFMQGDSTMRQWYFRLVDRIAAQSEEITESQEFVGPFASTDNASNVRLHFRFHGEPIQKKVNISFENIHYVADELDKLTGGPDVVVILGLWAHFVAEPLVAYRSRLYAISHAIKRLVHRAPATKVIIRTSNTRRHDKLFISVQASDWLAQELNVVIRDIFGKHDSVAILDVWEMTLCQEYPDDAHPNVHVVDSELSLLLSYICPV
ncbi:NXPE family member 3-like [Branchiostoma floridae x Branchiostoma japonicum]